ncbi:hypothetical protein EDC94DRAFT_603374, partial [Helicostylum pulchrum]
MLIRLVTILFNGLNWINFNRKEFLHHIGYLPNYSTYFNSLFHNHLLVFICACNNLYFIRRFFCFFYSTVVVFNVLTPVVFWSPLNVTGYTAGKLLFFFSALS